MNRCLACLAITVLLCSITDLAAQDNVSQTKSKEEVPESQKFKVKTELMEVRSVVTDQKGRIIENLKKDDFELLENDKPQEISFFSVSRVEGEPSRPAAAEVGAQDNAARLRRAQERLSEPPLRTTLLYVDSLHLSFSSLNWVKQALRRFINERLTEQDMVALATSGQTLGIAQQFTRNRQLLNYAIEQIRPSPLVHDSFFTPLLAARVVAERQDAIRVAVDIVRRDDNIECPCSLLRSLARDRANRILTEASYSRKTMLSALRDFAEQMIRMPGKHMIVVFSDGFTMHDSDGSIHNDELQSAISRAVRSGVAIYSIDAKGLQAPPTIDAGRSPSTFDSSRDTRKIVPGQEPATSVKCAQDEINPDPRCSVPDPGIWTSVSSEAEQEKLNGLYAMADETGGKMYSGTNNLNDSLARAFDANRFYYTLSYYLPAGIDDHRFRSIKVRVRNHPEYTVRTPRGYLPSDTTEKPEDEAGKTPQQRLLQAMKAPLPLTDLGVSAQADSLETETDDKQVSLIVYFDGDRFQYREQDQRNAVELEILYVIYDSSGKQVDGISARVEGSLSPDRATQAKTSGYRFSRRLTLKPGVYQVRIGVREEGTNRTGTATTWVEVPELAPDKLEMSSLMLRNPLDTDPAAREGINVSELEQVRIIQGIPLYARDDFCDYSFRVHRSVRSPAGSDLVWMKELLKDGKPIKQEKWQPISVEEEDIDSKGWFDVDGDVDLNGFDPGVYELRISVKDARSNKTVQRAAVFGVE